MRWPIFLFLFLVLQTQCMAQTRTVMLELVLAVDTSTSVDEREFELQRRGLADAFAHPELVSIIEGMGSAGIAVTLVEWAGTDRQATIVDWSLLTDRSSSLNFSQRLRAAPRALKGMTDIGSVLHYAMRSIEANGYEGQRIVIDVSGDGSSSTDETWRARDLAVSRGITINGLVIFNDEYDLGSLAEVDLIQHYSNQVIGGNGAFLMTTKGFEDFRRAILAKLIREILGNGVAIQRTP